MAVTAIAPHHEEVRSVGERNRLELPAHRCVRRERGYRMFRTDMGIVSQGPVGEREGKEESEEKEATVLHKESAHSMRTERLPPGKCNGSLLSE
jgi:hypothetical protein